MGRGEGDPELFPSSCFYVWLKVFTTITYLDVASGINVLLEVSVLLYGNEKTAGREGCAFFLISPSRLGKKVPETSARVCPPWGPWPSCGHAPGPWLAG